MSKRPTARESIKWFSELHHGHEQWHWMHRPCCMAYKVGLVNNGSDYCDCGWAIVFTACRSALEAASDNADA